MDTHTALACVKKFVTHDSEFGRAPLVFESVDEALVHMQSALLHEAGFAFQEPLCAPPQNPHLHSVDARGARPGVARQARSGIEVTFADADSLPRATYDCLRRRRVSTAETRAPAPRSKLKKSTVEKAVAAKREKALQHAERHSKSMQREEERAAERERVRALSPDERRELRAKQREEREARKAAKLAAEEDAAREPDDSGSPPASDAEAPAEGPAEAPPPPPPGGPLADDTCCEAAAHAMLPSKQPAAPKRGAHVFFETPVPHDRALRALECAAPSEALHDAVLRGEQSPALELIHGPPGCGKTHALLDSLCDFLAAHPDARALLVSPTNVGVSDTYVRSCERGLASALSQHRSRRPVDMPLLRGHSDFESAAVVCCTVAGRNGAELSDIPFSAIFVDEAGLIPESQTWGLLRPEVTHLVLAGDPEQLAARASPSGTELGVARSLMERLMDLSYPARMLSVQRRSRPEIFEFANRTFYGGKLSTEVPPAADGSVPALRMVVCTDGREERVGTSYRNSAEARAVEEIARDRDVMVLSPYLGQNEELIRAGVRNLRTIDAFQGREADHVVLTLVRSECPGFWTERGRLLVAMTRARESLVIVCSQGDAFDSGLLADLRAFCDANGVVETM